MADLFVTSNGHIYLAEGDTAPPDDDAFPTGSWLDYGDCNEDGLTLNRAQETNKITSGFTGSTLAEPKTSESFEFQINFITDGVSEADAAVAGLWHGVEWEDAGNGVLKAVRGPITPKRYALLFDAYADAVGLVHRYYEPRVEITERGETPYKAGDATIYPVKFAAFTSADVEGEITRIPLANLVGGS